MIEEKSQIQDLYDLKHRHDSLENKGFDYENNLFNRLLSNVMFSNETMVGFLSLLQENTVWMIDSVLPLRNWWNVTVSKYYNNHNN